jgi:hypothetical protein
LCFQWAHLFQKIGAIWSPCSQRIWSYLASNLFNYSVPDEVYSRNAFQIRNLRLYCVIAIKKKWKSRMVTWLENLHNLFVKEHYLQNYIYRLYPIGSLSVRIRNLMDSVPIKLRHVLSSLHEILPSPFVSKVLHVNFSYFQITLGHPRL